MGLNGVHGRHGAGAAGDGPRDAPREIHVEIDELALDGFRGDPGLVLAAFENELARLVREHGVPLAADGEPHTLDALTGLPPLPATVSAGRLGEALARSVHAGLAGDGEDPERTRRTRGPDGRRR
ncbi:hypothetical protein [Streptomyces sp. WMMB 322]|uniref:hypothetical protein n=1 Tax=Streptomyces sp. WMMB 322 TaxID=1286821 RepID=UPI000823D339|nr:hypothetical protein [Streptomyces sp. WMMB 322]SCK08539.1 hypothetical protein H180DRAFT_00381 [Streptomyces sp. WMMB 322]